MLRGSASVVAACSHSGLFQPRREQRKKRSRSVFSLQLVHHPLLSGGFQYLRPQLAMDLDRNTNPPLRQLVKLHSWCFFVIFVVTSAVLFTRAKPSYCSRRKPNCDQHRRLRALRFRCAQRRDTSLRGDEIVRRDPRNGWIATRRSYRATD